jgi:plasmid stabilization system protein ParE
MKVVYSEGALKDIELAEDYYYRISPDLANRFLEMLVETEQEIK